MNDKAQRATQAVALKYDKINAPKLSAKGDDDIARQIIDIAKANDVYIHQDPALTGVLSQLALGDEIPEALYVTIATIIAFVYRMNNKYP